MPYRKPYRKKNKRPGYKSCGRMIASDAAKALAMARYVKGLVNVEFKNSIFQLTSTDVPETGLRTTLFSLSQDDTNQTRDGNSVRFKSLYLKYMLSIHASAAETQVRVVLVYDGKSNGVQPLLAQMFQDVTLHDGLVSPVNINLSSRFKIIYDRIHTLSSSGRGTLSAKIYKKINMKCQYNGIAGTIADLQDKNITLVFISNEVTNHPTVTSMVQLRYIDN